jgi:putative exporter of polyketide antibiotics
MGRRARKRRDPAAAAVGQPAERPRAAAPRRDERPRAPWHPFPLVELSVLIGLVLIVWGLFRADEDSGRVMLLCGLALGSLAGLETALREHFTGHRSHALLLAAVPAVLVAGVLFFARAPWPAIPLAAGLTLAAAVLALRRRS